MSLLQKHCVPCEGGTEPLSQQREDELHSAVPDWQLERSGVHQIWREFELRDFTQAVKLLNQIGELAEAEGHHPDLLVHSYKHLKVTLWTHAIEGLSENDFIMAAKIDQIWKERS